MDDPEDSNPILDLISGAFELVCGLIGMILGLIILFISCVIVVILNLGTIFNIIKDWLQGMF